jgi:hypothetical protein
MRQVGEREQRFGVRFQREQPLSRALVHREHRQTAQSGVAQLHALQARPEFPTDPCRSEPGWGQGKGEAQGRGKSSLVVGAVGDNVGDGGALRKRYGGTRENHVLD